MTICAHVFYRKVFIKNSHKLQLDQKLHKFRSSFFPRSSPGDWFCHSHHVFYSVVGQSCCFFVELFCMKKCEKFLDIFGINLSFK